MRNIIIMKVVVQRVKHASVTIGGTEKSRIGAGMLVLLGISPDDTQANADWLVKKCVNLRIFDDDEGIMNHSLLDVGGEMLVVSQFTLMASTKKGNRPSYVHAAGHDIAIPLYEYFVSEAAKALGKPVGTGEFGANMQVELVNDGPVTIIIEG